MGLVFLTVVWLTCFQGIVTTWGESAGSLEFVMYQNVQWRNSGHLLESGLKRENGGIQNTERTPEESIG